MVLDRTRTSEANGVSATHGKGPATAIFDPQRAQTARTAFSSHANNLPQEIQLKVLFGYNNRYCKTECFKTKIENPAFLMALWCKP